MTPAEAIAKTLEKGPVRLGLLSRFVLAALAILGTGSLAVGFVLGRPAWSVEAFLVATLVTAGLAQVGIVWSAVFEITHARWGRSFRRIMELSLTGAPVALMGLALLLVSSPWWVPFSEHQLEGFKGLWLSVPFWALRNFAAVLGLFALSAYYLVHCLRPDLGLAKEKGQAYPGQLTERLTRGWTGAEAEVARSARIRAVLAPVLCIAYALVYSLVGFDLVMALDVYWYSTLFGAYHFTGNVYMGLALVVLLAAALRRRIGPAGFFSPKHFGILGAMLFAFCFLMGDFFWSQFLTIYYGNLPEEVGWVLERTMDPAFPWRYLAWGVLAGFFGIPFLTLVFRAVKWVPWRVSLVAVVVLLSMVAERFLTTAPPVLKLCQGAAVEEMLVPLGLAFAATLGLVAISGLLYGLVMRQVPMLPVGDPLLADSLKDSAERNA